MVSQNENFSCSLRFYLSGTSSSVVLAAMKLTKRRLFLGLIVLDVCKNIHWTRWKVENSSSSNATCILPHFAQSLILYFTLFFSCSKQIAKTFQRYVRQRPFRMTNSAWNRSGGGLPKCTISGVIHVVVVSCDRLTFLIRGFTRKIDDSEWFRQLDG